MIDISRELLVTFPKLARSLPPRRGDRPVHTATIHRWRSRGLKGIRLEAVRVGGAWHTSQEAFARFASRLTAQAEAGEDTTNGTSNCRSASDASDALQKGGW